MFFTFGREMFEFLNDCVSMIIFEQTPVHKFPNNPFFFPLTNVIPLCFVHTLWLNRFLDEVQSYSGINKMSVQNLATVFGPNILRPKVEDPLTIMEGKWITIIYRHQKNSQ